MTTESSKHAHKPIVNPDLAERLAEKKAQRLINESRSMRFNWGVVLIVAIMLVAIGGLWWTVDAIIARLS